MKRVLWIVAFATLVTATYQILGQGGRPPQAGPPQTPPGLEVAHQRLLPLFELAGVVFTDADEARGRLVVGVIDRDVEPAVRAIVNGQGVPMQLVDVVESEPIIPVETLRDYVRPVVGGLQIRFSQYLCSLSFNAIRNGVSGYVTASHCSTTQGGADGTLYYQPLDQVAGQLIGQETADPPFFKNRNGCPRGKKCRYSDANFSRASDSTALGVIARTSGPNNNSFDIVGDFLINGEGTVAVGEIANKVGRSTAWTQGAVSNTCANTGVSGSNIVLLCQNFVQAPGVIVVSGDSGSGVFKITSGNNVTLLGTLWGSGNSGRLFVYSPIANIEQELGPLTTH